MNMIHHFQIFSVVVLQTGQEFVPMVNKEDQKAVNDITRELIQEKTNQVTETSDGYMINVLKPKPPFQKSGYRSPRSVT